MAGRVTGIDISTEGIAAVRTERGLKGCRILACAWIPLDGGGLKDGLQRLCESMDLSNDECLVTIREDYVSFRNVSMPFTDIKKIRQALPFEVEGMLPYPVEDILIDFVTTDGSSGTGVLSASVRKNDLSEYLEALQSNGIDPGAVEVRGSPLALWLLKQSETPDHILVLEPGQKRHTLVLCLNRRIALIRSFLAFPDPGAPGGPGPEAIPDRTGMTGEDGDPLVEDLCRMVRHTVHAFCCMTGISERPQRLFFTEGGVHPPLSGGLLGRLLGMPAERIDVSQDKRVRMEGDAARNWSPGLMSGALSLSLRNTWREGGFNLRKDAFGREKRYVGFRKAIPKAAIFLFLILAFAAADMIVDTYFLKKEYQALDQEITRIFRQTLPQATRIVDPVQQLRVEVEQIRRSSVSRPADGFDTSILGLLQEISKRIPPLIRVQVHRMVVDPETVRISGRTEAFHEVDRIKNDLSASPIFGAVNITSANLDRTGNKVQFEMTIERKR